MFSTYINTGAVLGAMLVTGIILAPAVMATPAVQDLTDLRDVINAAANTIGDLNNPNRGWGLFGSSSQMGTADTVNNVTATILQSKFQVDTNKVEVIPLFPIFMTDSNADDVAQSGKYNSQHHRTAVMDTHSSSELQSDPSIYATNQYAESREHHCRSLDPVYRLRLVNTQSKYKPYISWSCLAPRDKFTSL